MTVLFTRWRFDNYKKRRILHSEKNCEKFREPLFTFRQHRTEHFDDIFFHGKFQNFKIPILAMFKL